MKYIIFLAFAMSSHALAGSIYQCTNEKGDVIFQSLPCEETTVNVIKEESEVTNQEYTAEMMKALSRLSGESEAALKNPEIRKAAELLAAADAAKSYAYTQVYRIAAKHCGAAVDQALNAYTNKAKEIISLGKHYYKVGIQSNVNGKDMGYSGKELTDSLNEMLADLDKKYASYSGSALSSVCRESTQALNMLTSAYGR